MAQILTGPTPQQMTAQQIGSPIIQSLERLTRMQLDNISKQRQRSDIMAGLSTLMPPEQADLFSRLPPYLQFSLLGKRGGGRNVKLSKEQAMQFLESAGGDKNLARRMAKEIGFTL